jgi:tetratricopeptide (TPR) repeat protein
MKPDSDTRTAETDLIWLKNDDPEIYHLLRALDGDLDALRWLKHRGDGLFVFVEALTGAKEAVETLQAYAAKDLVDLFDTISHCDVDDWLRENHAEIHCLFAFVRGDEGAFKGIKHNRATLKRVAEIVRDKYRNYREEDIEGVSSTNGAAADVGCLIGEMHLNNRDYHKAIEAFSRALANDPTADAHAGRARAYRALAQLDDRAATELRARFVR